MSKRTDILSAAEKRVRLGGYDNFSFRDLASDVGIKSASVHYHFPTKGSLGKALVADYTTRFFESINTNNDNQSDWLGHYINLFRSALVDEKLMCLCGLLGAESDGVPDEVNEETQRFFQRNLAYLKAQLVSESGYSEQQAESTAALVLASLEGAMIVAKATGDDGTFDSAMASLRSLIDQ